MDGVGSRVVGVALLLGLAGGCCAAPWDVYPEATLPDRSCTTGGSVYGDDVYIWDCLNGSKVVVWQYSSEWVCRAPEREVVACGSPATIEADPSLDCAGPRPGREWMVR